MLSNLAKGTIYSFDLKTKEQQLYFIVGLSTL